MATQPDWDSVQKSIRRYDEIGRSRALSDNETSNLCRLIKLEQQMIADGHNVTKHVGWG